MDVRRIQHELQELARRRDALGAGDGELTELSACAAAATGRGDLEGIHELIDLATSDMTTAERDAARLLFGNTERRFVDNLKTRRTAAGDLLGLSEATFRKKRDGASPYDQLALSVAEAIDTLAPGTGAPEVPLPAGAPVTGPGERHTRRLVAAAAVVVVLAGATLVYAALRNRDDRPAASGVPGSSDDSATDAVTSPPAGQTTPPVEETTTVPPTTERVTPGRALPDCDIRVGGSFGAAAPPDTVIDAAVRAYADGAPGVELGCPSGLIEQWQQLWVQPVDGPGGEWMITVEADAPEWAFVLSPQLYRGYWRILDGENGSMAQVTAGVPREVDNDEPHPSIRFDNGSLLVGENAHVMARWMPGPAAALWDAQGGPDGPLGMPITDGNFIDCVPRIDFQRGWGELQEGAVSTTVFDADQIAADVAALPRGTSMILETFDHTSWWVDADGVRHWIDSIEVWNCLGGQDAKVTDDVGDDGFVPGWVVGSFPLGDEAACDG